LQPVRQWGLGYETQRHAPFWDLAGV